MRSAIRTILQTPKLPLDLIPERAFSAYSLRRLSRKYNGFSCNVTRSSNGASKDIGFVGNEPDIGSIVDFVGASDGSILFYDQSGNARHTSGSAKPKIIISGLLQTANGMPTIYQNGATLNAPVISSANITMNAVYKMVSANTFIYNGDNLSNGFGFYANGPRGILAQSISFYTSSTTYSAGLEVSTLTSLNNKPSMYVNGVNIALSGDGTPNFPSTSFSLFSGIWYCSEIINFNSVIAPASQKKLEYNQMRYYKIF